MNILSRIMTPVIAAFSAVAAANAASLDISADERVDLVYTVFHYAGNPEFSNVNIPEYAKGMDEYFAPYKEHPVIQMARELHDKHSVSYNAVTEIAIILDSPDSLRLTEGSMESMDKRWPREKVEEFLTLLRDFSQKSDFHSFFSARKELYCDQYDYWRKIVKDAQCIPWVEKFYGEERPIHFFIIPTVFEEGGIAQNIVRNNELYCGMVCAVVDPDYKRPESRTSGFIVHELSHTWINPLTAAIYPQIQETAEKFFNEVQSVLPESYRTPAVMMIETFNRAATAVYLHDQYGEEIAMRRCFEDLLMGFLLVTPIYKCIIEEREKGGENWHYADSAQVYVEWVNSPGAVQLLEKYIEWKEKAPKIVSFSPENGAPDVDPQTTEIVIKFDKPMRSAYSICRDGRGEYPEVSDVQYNEDRTVLTMKVKLKPDTEYRMWFNSLSNDYFRSQDGGRLADTEYLFSTGK